MPTLPDPLYRSETQNPFQKGETIRETDTNKNFELLKEGLAFDVGAVITEAIKNGTIKIEDLAAEVTNLLAGFGTEIEHFDLVGTTTMLTLTKPPTTDSELVFVNGLIQKKGEFYTLSGNTITFVDPTNDTRAGYRVTVSYEAP